MRRECRERTPPAYPRWRGKRSRHSRIFMYLAKGPMVDNWVLHARGPSLHKWSFPRQADTTRIAYSSSRFLSLTATIIGNKQRDRRVSGWIWTNQERKFSPLFHVTHGPRLLTWLIVKPTMDKQSHVHEKCGMKLFSTSARLMDVTTYPC